MAAPSAGDGPRPPAPEPLISRAHPSLEHLPSELLQPIAEGLVPAAPLTTRFALRSTGTWEFRDAGHQWADWLAAYNNLLAFAQTSRRMAAVAKPWLFHTLVIPTGAALVTLFRRMNERPEVRPWIRSITCLANVAGVLTADEVHREWQRQTGVSWQAPHQSTIALDLLRAVLVNAPNLRDFLVACPDQDHAHRGGTGHQPADVLMPSFRDVILRYLTDSYLPSCQTLPAAHCVPLDLMRSLTSLRIYCHREDGDRGLTLSRMLADVAVWSLPRLRSLRTLELCCAPAASPFSGGGGGDDAVPLPPLPQIEHLRIYGSHMHEPRLVAFCLACVNLQTLVVHFEASSTDEDRDRLPEGKTLNDALAGLAGSLRTLELVALAEGHYLTRGRERPRKPENHRLRCIPELRRLESLMLDYRGVFGTLGILEEDDGERLCQLLPPSLRHFTLVCEWGTAGDWRQSYLANLDMVLHGVDALCAAAASGAQHHRRRLSTISLAVHSWPAESRFHRRFKRALESARQRCARAGIRFGTFDLLPSYRDEDEMEPADEEEHGEEEAEEEEDQEHAEEPAEVQDEEEYELEEEDEASEYYFSGDEESDPEREARRPPTFDAFLERLGEDHGHSLDELFYAYHEDRWDEYLF